jgi:anti-sigma regulatory factor (Ser/Thr protein kinase)
MQPQGGSASDVCHQTAVLATAPLARAVTPLSSATPPFAALSTAPSMARGHVRAALAGWGLAKLIDDAETIASELVANAVEASTRATGGTKTLVIRLCLLTDGDVLAIECWDQAPGFPMLREANALAETGHGLAIIDAITDGCWGCQPAIGQDGKCVWGKIALRNAKGHAT